MLSYFFVLLRIVECWAVVVFELPNWIILQKSCSLDIWQDISGQSLKMAVHRAVGLRDPIPYPRLESDDNFIGKRETEVSLLINVYYVRWYEYEETQRDMAS